MSNLNNKIKPYRNNKFFFIWFIAQSILLPSASLAVQTCQSEESIPTSTPSAVLIDNQDGTVTDTRTNLVWSKCSVGLDGNACDTGTPNNSDWAQALQSADQSELGGYDDWRLPNIKELLSIVEVRCFDPAINSTSSAFPNTQSLRYWASTLGPLDNTAWVVDFISGASLYTNRDRALPVRLVRN